MPSEGVLGMTREEIAGASKADGGMFAVIPAVVMRDSALSMSARMLYGIITWRCNSDSRCWPTNRALGEDLGLSPKRISSLLSLLEAQGHIEVEIVCDPDTGQIIRRYLYPIVKSGRGIPKNKDTSPKECGEGIPENENTSTQTGGEGIPENEEEKYKEEIININTPYSPPLGDEPDLFERFWSAYPPRQGKRGGKKAARRAWDKLKPDMALCRRMAAALDRDKASPQWQEANGKYIPMASTWLNARAWEDEYIAPPDQPPPRMAAREEVPTW